MEELGEREGVRMGEGGSENGRGREEGRMAMK